MKAYVKILLLFGFLVLTSTESKAQENSYFENNPVWQFYNTCEISYPCVMNDTATVYINGDTLINGLTYKKVFENGFGSLSSLSGSMEDCVGTFEYNHEMPSYFLRSAGKQIFRKGYIFETESLLYDFNLEVGSSLPLTYNNYYSNVFVTAIDSIYTPYGYRKRFAISGNTVSDYLIEGIGHSRGLNQPLNSSTSCTHELGCYSLNSIIYYTEFGEDCLMTVNVNSVAEKPALSVFPNPFVESTTISYPGNTGIPVIMVYNLQGQQVQVKANVFENHLVIDRGNLNSGLYIYRLILNSQILAAGKLFVVD